jgi:hypothetical protein
LGGSLADVASGTRGSSPKTSSSGAAVEYRIVRNVLARQVRLGKLSRDDVCDAHPELIRAGTHIGKPTGLSCPVCEAEETKSVNYVFGDKLPAGGTCPTTKTELNRLLRREAPVLCYEVEVCLACKFHHLMRKYPAGGVKVRKRKATS